VPVLFKKSFGVVAEVEDTGVHPHKWEAAGASKLADKFDGNSKKFG
jgi:hypothetical protein